MDKTRAKGLQVYKNNIINLIKDPKHDRIANDHYVISELIGDVSYYLNYPGIDTEYPDDGEISIMYESLGYRPILTDACIDTKKELKGRTVGMALTLWAKEEPLKGFYNPHNNRYYKDARKYFSSMKKDVRRYYDQIDSMLTQAIIDKGE